MHSDKQQGAREHLKTLLTANTPTLAKRAQEQKYGLEIAEEVWANPSADRLLRLDKAESAYLLRTDSFPAELQAWIAKALAERVGPDSIEARGNSELRKRSLEKNALQIVKAAWDSIRQRLDPVFERKQSCHLADPREIKVIVIQNLNDFCCSALGAGEMSEDELKRRLKILVVLAAPAAHEIDQEMRIRGLTNGRIAALPFVPKFLIPHTSLSRPKRPSFDPGHPNPFRQEIIDLFPEARPIQLCVTRFLNREGLFQTFSSPDRPMSHENAELFRRFGPYVPTRGGILAQNREALNHIRRGSARLPEGAVSLMGFTILLESFLRQIIYALQNTDRPTLRGYELVERVNSCIGLGSQTKSLLDWVFGTSTTEGRRDSYAHAVFTVEDDALLEQELRTLEQTLVLIEQDLSTSEWSKVVNGPSWNHPSQLTQEQLAIFDMQASHSNLLHNPDIEEARSHAFRVFKQLIPDKDRLATSAMLFWLHLDTESSMLAGDEGAEFAGIVGSLLSLEELLRAISEVKNERILNVSRVLFPVDAHGKVESGFKCEFSFLDESPGQLLEDARMERMFPRQWQIPEFQKSIHIVRLVRDRVFHGGWQFLPPPRGRFLHLILKLMLAFCEVVTISD
jgi:hypothetical protein